MAGFPTLHSSTSFCPAIRQKDSGWPPSPLRHPRRTGPCTPPRPRPRPIAIVVDGHKDSSHGSCPSSSPSVGAERGNRCRAVILLPASPRTHGTAVTLIPGESRTLTGRVKIRGNDNNNITALDLAGIVRSSSAAQRPFRAREPCPLRHATMACVNPWLLPTVIPSCDSCRIPLGHDLHPSLVSAPDACLYHVVYLHAVCRLTIPHHNRAML